LSGVVADLLTSSTYSSANITLFQLLPQLIDDIILPKDSLGSIVNQGTNIIVLSPAKTYAALSGAPNDTVLGPANFMYPGW
jgi:hypothetical protein